MKAMASKSVVVTSNQIARVRSLIAARQSVANGKTTWDGDSWMDNYTATTEALEALVSLATANDDARREE